MILSMLCKLPRWLGGGCNERRLTKKEMQNPPAALEEAPEQGRICRRCPAERAVKARKKTTKETT